MYGHDLASRYMHTSGTRELFTRTKGRAATQKWAKRPLRFSHPHSQHFYKQQPRYVIAVRRYGIREKIHDLWRRESELRTKQPLLLRELYILNKGLLSVKY